MSKGKRGTSEAQAVGSLVWQYYPRSRVLPKLPADVLRVFEMHLRSISSANHEMKSNEVLAILGDDLVSLGLDVERSAGGSKHVKVPVLFGLNGRVDKAFRADAWHREAGLVLEVEAGRAVVNNQFLKDLFQACMMQEVRTLCIAVRRLYREGPDFENVVKFFDTLYASQRLSLPLDGILIIGY